MSLQVQRIPEDHTMKDATDIKHKVEAQLKGFRTEHDQAQRTARLARGIASVSNEFRSGS